MGGEGSLSLRRSIFRRGIDIVCYNWAVNLTDCRSEKGQRSCMTSAKKIEANRRNAALSTGPRTVRGKAVVSRNAIKHGLLARDVVLPYEDCRVFEELATSVGARLRAVAGMERVLVERIVALQWRLRRLGKIEAALFSSPSNTADLSMWAPVVGPDAAIAREVGVEDMLVRAFTRAQERFETLMRYEATLDRALYKALHELQRLQAARAGKQVEPPAAIDISVDVAATSS
jgi:hypothetical protein